ncbi:MAG: zf-HC2 domain-containing protein [Gammaproteobacteria bacterium]|nr:zf-HC2 domain-containing protein [Gammaproteobacteria bacterium]
MSCPKTQYLLQEYFSEDLSAVARDELDRHLSDCAHCNAELESVLFVQRDIQQWQEQSVPHWDRGRELFRREHRAERPLSQLWLSRQWFPTAASLAMLCVLLFNVSVVSNESGFSVSFGGSSGANIDLRAQLAQFEQAQRGEMRQLVARVESRQDSNNVQLLQAVMEQAQQSTADSFDQMYAYFEQQRLLDLQDMRAGYEQLVDSDYETIRSLQQLVNYVGYQGDIR